MTEAQSSNPKAQRFKQASTAISRRLTFLHISPLTSLMFFLAFSLLPFTFEPAYAGPFDDFGMGSRDAAMGGAYTAIADDFSGAYYNPGALAMVGEARFGLGYLYTQPRLDLNSQRCKIENVLGIPFGFVTPLGGVFRRKAAFGLSGFMHGDSLIYDVAMPPLNEPDFALDRHRLRQQVVMFAASAQVFSFLSLGAGAQVQASIPSSVSMYLDAGLLLSGTPTPDAPPSGLNYAVDVYYLITPIAGLMINFSPRLKIGIAFRDKLDMRIKVKSSEIASGLGDSPQTLDIDISSHILFTPRQYVLGTAVDVLPELTLAFDLLRTDWSDFPNPSAHISLSSPDPEIDQSLPVVPPPPDPNFSDTLSQRFGIEYRVRPTPKIQAAFRAGYGFNPSPVPDQTGVSNFLDSDRHTFSGGLGFSFPAPFGLTAKPIEAGLHFRYQILTRREISKADTVDEENPGYPGYTIEGEILSGGFSLGFTF